mgnify:CR=1 FL=1
MQEAKEAEKESYLQLTIELEGKKHEYQVKRRPLVWFRNFVIIDLTVIILASIVEGIWGNIGYINSWCTLLFWIFGIFLFILFLHFFNIIYNIISFIEYNGEEFGFRGIERIKALIALQDEIAGVETVLRILEQYQTSQLSTEEQYELYKDASLQVIRQYQRGANRNRRWYYSLQLFIIFCSLLVTGLTSGLTNLISIFGNHWITPAISFAVTFLTAIITLFRPRERGYNLQQTADAIEFEIACADRRIYSYKDLTDREAYTKLAEEVEKLRNEQRKRQQQLEQASEVKHVTD